MNGMFIKKAALALAMLALLLAPACSSVAPTPSVTSNETFEPVPSAARQKAVVEIPMYDSNTEFNDMLARLNGWLDKAGQNVEFRICNISNPSLYMTAIRTEASAGSMSASAYALNLTDSGALFNDSITMDLTALIQQNAPVYFSKYRDLFPDSLSGVPVDIYKRPLWLKPALMLRKDFESTGSGISTIEELFKFADEAIAPTNGRYFIITEPYSLINEWALEQGYYNLDCFNIYGYLYASVDDVKCAPVTLESIPGFLNFFNKLCSYYKSGMLNSSPEMNSDSQIIGYINYLNVYFYTNPYSTRNWASWIKGDFTAHALSPELPSYLIGPCYNMELALPATDSTQTSIDVIRFVEWMYSNQDNYDVVMYGEKGVDFNEANGRFTPLVNGQNMEMTSNDQPSKFFFTWPGCNVLFNSDFYRVPSVTPAKVEAVVDDGIKRDFRFPLCQYFTTYGIDANEKLNATDEIKNESDVRQQMIDRFLFRPLNALAVCTKDDITALFDGLSGCKNTQLVEAYAGLIKSYIDKAKSD